MQICKAGDVAGVAELDGKQAGARGGASFLGQVGLVLKMLRWVVRLLIGQSSHWL